MYDVRKTLRDDLMFLEEYKYGHGYSINLN